MRRRIAILPIFVLVISVTAFAQEPRQTEKSNDEKTQTVSQTRPHIVLVMADDQGWGQTGYQNHPLLKTPNLDRLASEGLRFDRFYAGSAVCSPTRATVLTGRTPVRAGVPEHGYALRHQEITLPQILSDAGYRTGHFGKWHLDGLRGPGVPILSDDKFHPGTFGFDTWLSTTNFFDRDPILSRAGKFENFRGDSSEVVIDQALQFIRESVQEEKPSLSVVWYGTPHSPFYGDPNDRKPFDHLDSKSANHYAELVAMDRSIGTLREKLAAMGIQKDTMIWFCSDNGGLPKINPGTVGDLRGNKGTIYEGGLRVPGIICWPGTVLPAVTDTPACAADMMPTLLDLVGVKSPDPTRPLDGVSIRDWFAEPPADRGEPLFFMYRNQAAIVDNDWKLIRTVDGKKSDQLFHLVEDVAETKNRSSSDPDVFARLQRVMDSKLRSVTASRKGADYPEGRVDPQHPEPKFWDSVEGYQPYLAEFAKRDDYNSWAKRSKRDWAVTSSADQKSR